MTQPTATEIRGTGHYTGPLYDARGNVAADVYACRGSFWRVDCDTRAVRLCRPGEPERALRNDYELAHAGR